MKKKKKKPTNSQLHSAIAYFITGDWAGSITPCKFTITLFFSPNKFYRTTF